LTLENEKMEIKTDIYLGDSREQLKRLPKNSVDLIVTSPPYETNEKAHTVALTQTITLSGFCLFLSNF